jgi:hypothetical protein
MTTTTTTATAVILGICVKRDIILKLNDIGFTIDQQWMGFGIDCVGYTH